MNERLVLFMFLGFQIWISDFQIYCCRVEQVMHDSFTHRLRQYCSAYAEGHLLYQIWYPKHKSSDTGVLDVPKRNHDGIVLIRKERWYVLM